MDDGSNDKSLSIIDKYAFQDNKIKLVKQNHLFAGTARNNGLKIAQGKYIIFLDSDDFFDKNLLKNSFELAEKESAEIVVFGYRYYDDKKKKNSRPCYPNPPKNIFSSNESDDLFNGCYTVPWNKMFLKSFMLNNNISFQSLKKCNDVFLSS